jgi:hypothetical protein
MVSGRMDACSSRTAVADALIASTVIVLGEFASARYMVVNVLNIVHLLLN